MGVQQRYIFACLAAAGGFFNLSGRNCLNLAIVSIAEEWRSCQNSTEDSTEKDCGDNQISWTDDAVATVLGAFFWGIFVSEVVSGPMVDLVGGKRTMLVANIVAGASTLATPWLVQTNLLCLVIIQVVAGLSMGVAVPSFHNLLGRWEPEGEKGRLATIIYTGSPLSSVVCLLITGWLTKLNSWSLPFYFFGGCTLVLWLPAWALLVTDYPGDQRFIKQQELDLYNGNRATDIRPSLHQIPWVKILSSPPVWAAVLANTAYVQAFSFTASLLPQLLAGVFRLPPNQSGLLLTLPFISNYLISFFSALMSSVLLSHGFSLLAVRKLATSLSLAGMALAFLLLPSIGDYGVAATLAIITAGYGLTGFHLNGAWCSPIDLAPNFAATMMGLSGLCSYSLASVLPLLFSQLVTDKNSVSGWSLPLYLTGALLLFACIVFLMAGKADKQTWNKVVLTNDQEKNSTRL